MVERGGRAASHHVADVTAATLRPIIVHAVARQTRLHTDESVHRTKILAHLQERGIMGGEVNPMRQLAAFLSVHRDRFEPDGKGNFRLRGTTAARPNEQSEKDTGWSLLEPAGHEIGA